MDWSSFARLIRQHAPYPSSILFIKQDGYAIPTDIVTICDLRLPHRKGLLHTGHTYDDVMRDSQVCNASWLNGEIPMRGRPGTDIVSDRPIRGVQGTLKILLEQGSIRPSTTLDHLLGADSREWCPSDMRIHYNEVVCE